MDRYRIPWAVALVSAEVGKLHIGAPNVGQGMASVLPMDVASIAVRSVQTMSA
jgi:hypothetical protein